MTMTRAEQVQSRGNEGIRALSDPRPWATGAPAIPLLSQKAAGASGENQLTKEIQAWRTRRLRWIWEERRMRIPTKSPGYSDMMSPGIPG